MLAVGNSRQVRSSLLSFPCSETFACMANMHTRSLVCWEEPAVKTTETPTKETAGMRHGSIPAVSADCFSAATYVQVKSGDANLVRSSGVKLCLIILCVMVQAGGGVQLCPDAQVDDGLLDVTYIINPELAQARHHPWRRGLKWLLQRAAVSTILIPMQLSVPYLAFSVVCQIPTILGDLQNDKRLDGPKGQIRCSWLEVECPDELQVIFSEAA